VLQNIESYIKASLYKLLFDFSWLLNLLSLIYGTIGLYIAIWHMTQFTLYYFYMSYIFRVDFCWYAETSR